MRRAGMWRLTVATLTALVLCCVTSARQPHVLVPPRAGSPLHEVFSSGKPPAQYATGGIVWRGQQLAVRWEASDPPPGQLLVRGGEGVLAMVEVYLETERLSAEGGQDDIQLSMCAAAAGTRLPAEPCVTETFRLALKLPRARATWRPRARFAVSAGTLYWFIIQVGSLHECDAALLPPGGCQSREKGWPIAAFHCLLTRALIGCRAAQRRQPHRSVGWTATQCS